MNKKVLLALLVSLVTVACQPRERQLHVDNGYMNVRDMGDDYVHYELMEGDAKVTCREHLQRSELTCWPTLETYPDEGF